MLSWILENTLVTGVLALGVFFACRYQRARPTLCHCLWVLVLVRMLLPPLPFPTFSPELPVIFKALSRQKTFNVGAADDMIEEDLNSSIPIYRETSRTTGEKAEPTPIGFDQNNSKIEAVSPSTFAQSEYYSFRVSILQLLLIFWILGAVIVLFIQFRRMARFRAIIARHGAIPPDSLCREVESVAVRLGVLPPKVVTLPCIGTPFIWSLGGPVLLWPTVNLAKNEPGIRSVLAHEMAHLRRKDHWFSWLELAGMSLWWWHPLYWLIRARIRHHAELSCDAWAVWAYPKHRRAYADALIDAAARVSAPPSAVVAFAATQTDRRNFERRLTMIMRRGVSRKSSPYWLAGAVMLMLTALPSLSQKFKAPASDGFQWTRTDDQTLNSIIEAEALKHRAHSAFKAEDWDTAADTYQALIGVVDEKGPTYFRLGRALHLAGRDDEAIAALNQSVSLGGKTAKSFYQLALIHAGRGDATTLDYLDKAVLAGFMDAETLLEADLGRFSEDARFLRTLKTVLMQKKRAHVAEEAFNQGEWDKVIDLYREILATAPDYAHGYTRLGFAQIRGERFQDGLETFRTQIEMNHRVYTATYNIACIYALTGEGDKAVQYLDRAVKLGFDNPNHIRKDDDLNAIQELPGYKAILERLSGREDFKSRIKKAHSSKNTGELENLLAEYGDINALGSYAGEFFDQIGTVLHYSGRHESASVAFKQQARTGHNVAKAMYNLACTHAMMGDVDQSFTYLENALATGFDNLKHIARDSDLETLRDDPRFEAMMTRLAETSDLQRFKAKDWKHLYEKAFKKSKVKAESGAAEHKMGWALLRQGEIDRALESFQRQDELGYSPKTAKYNIACCYAIKGDHDQAFDWLQKAIDAGFEDPDHLLTDRDLASLREDPRFEVMIKNLK